MPVRVSVNDSLQKRAGTSATVAVCAAALLSAPGCGAVLGIFSGRGRTEAAQVRLSEQQARVMRFADEFAARVSEAGAAVERAAARPHARVELHGWRLAQITAAFIIATGENPVVNSLDMIVLTTLDHAVMQDYWLPRYGAAVRPLVDAHALLEREAWSLSRGMLTLQQEKNLRAMIDEWRRANPEVHSVAFIHFRDFSKTIGKQPTGGGQGPQSLFGLVGIDPFADLEPAVRELARNRLLAERALFYGQRLPMLLDMQVNHVTYQTAAMPETRQVIADVKVLATSVARFTNTMDTLPQLLAGEREAAIDQVLQHLETQREHARTLLNDARGVFEAGTTTAVAFDGAIRSLDELTARFEDRDKSKPQGAPSKPFDIDAYTAAAVELSRTAREIERLASTLSRTSPELSASVRAASEASQRVIDHAFARAVTLLAIALLGGLAVAVAYKYIAKHLAAR
jgi:hypothetical protein